MAYDAPENSNPLLKDWRTPFGMPPFDAIGSEHYRPAFDLAIAEHEAEIAAIAGSDCEPDFENTILALERSGKSLRKVLYVFFNLTGTDTSETLKEIEREISPVLARHDSAVFLNEQLFLRVDKLFDARDSLDLNPEQARVLERYHTAFVRSGARLGQTDKTRMTEITERLATLGTGFAQNVLADEAGFTLVLETEDDLAGLPGFLRDSAAQSAEERGMPGKHVITLSRSSIEPFLQFSTRRDLRERAFEAWTKRGENGGETDNRQIIAETLALRSERAGLLGFESFAHFKLDDQMAKRPVSVRDLLMKVWKPARKRALDERDDLQHMIRSEGGNFDLAAWDWRHYAEKVRKARHDLDETEIKPYFRLDRMIEAAFFTANRLFGLTFAERHGLPVYNPEVRVWEVTDADGDHVGLFCGDYFARPSKRSGAWMSGLRRQEKIDGEVHPIVLNVCNFSKGSEGEPALLSFDDVRTVFHEFGHALHGLLSDVTYPMISGTNVSRDFVELPSQLYEHWISERAVLQRFARHYRTGEPLPDELLDRILAARTFNRGFATVEYVSSALVDLDLHELTDFRDFDPGRFERETLESIGMPAEIVMRHRVPHFAHVFSGDGYSSGYYSYMWSEVMDADAFRAFEEAGDIFDDETARRLHDHIYSAGGKQDPADAYIAFRGKMPEVDALLEKRGLVSSADAA